MHRSLVRSVLIVLLAAVIVSCAQSTGQGIIATPAPPVNPCANGVPPSGPNKPIICIDDRDLAYLTTNPYKIWAKKNAKMTWYTTTGLGGLTITFPDEQCVKRGGPDCTPGYSCEAKLNGTGTAGSQCKYSVSITRGGGTTVEDPIVIIDAGMEP